jgi:sporulation protein YabP
MNYQNPVIPILSSQEINLKNRTDLHITGVKKLESLNSNEFFIDTVLGKMRISGTDLEMKNLDLEKEVLMITGKVNSMEYISKHKSEKDKSFLSKLFR